MAREQAKCYASHWDTKQALLPADARLYGREELALQMLSIRHRMELIYFVRTFALYLCTAFVLVCVFCAEVCMTMHLCMSERLREVRVCAYVFIRECLCMTEYISVCMHESL